MAPEPRFHPSEVAASAARSCRLCGNAARRPLVYWEGIEIARCLGCGFVQVATPVSPAGLKMHYERAREAAPPPSRDQARAYLANLRLRVKYFLTHTRLTSGTVAEIGSAEGDFLAVLKKKGFTVLGVEPSPLGVARHRQKGLQVIPTLLEEATLEDEAFDAICMFHVLEHMDHPRQAVARLRRALRPGGYLVVEVPDIFSWGARFEKQPHRLFDREHLSYFSLASLRTLMTEEGFGEIFHHHLDYDYLHIPAGKSLKKIFCRWLRPNFQGPLQQLLEQPEPLHYAGTEECRPAPRTTNRHSGRVLPLLRRMFLFPVNGACGYLAHRLDLGRNLLWIGRKD